MITDAILNLIYGVFGFIFDLLPIPDIPTWYDLYIKSFTQTYVARGTLLFSCMFPEGEYFAFITICITLFTVNIMYDIYMHFHKFR